MNDDDVAIILVEHRPKGRPDRKPDSIGTRIRLVIREMMRKLPVPLRLWLRRHFDLLRWIP